MFGGAAGRVGGTRRGARRGEGQVSETKETETTLEEATRQGRTDENRASR